MIHLHEVQALTRSFAHCVEALTRLGVRRRTIFDEVMREIVTGRSDIFGAWCVWEPNALDGRDRDFAGAPGHDQTGRYVPFWTRSGDSVEVEPNTNYNCEGVGDYYLVPRRTGCERTVLRADYFPVSGGRRTFSCHIVPLFQQSRFVGVVGIDVLPEKLALIAGSNSNSPLDRLSPREKEVLRWLAEGKNNPEVALILGISLHTAKRHVEKIFAKLGVESRHAAALEAQRLGR